MSYYIEPEVAGGFGEETILDSTTHPPIITKLHYEFSGWLGDDILESFPCFVISELLKIRIESECLSGITFDNVRITKSSTFLELYPDLNLPIFFWAKIKGNAEIDDFSIGKDYRLIVSEKAYNIIKTFKVDNALFEKIDAR